MGNGTAIGENTFNPNKECERVYLMELEEDTDRGNSLLRTDRRNTHPRNWQQAPMR